MTLTISAMNYNKTHMSYIPLFRFLWKEFRERCWWAICWAIIIVSVSLFAHGQHFCGDTDGVLPRWNYFPLIFAGIVGLGGYSSELQRGRAYFLFTRATKWQQPLLAKILFGSIIIIGSAALAAGLFRLTCAEPYRDFVTLPNVFTGIWQMAWPLIICYLGGLAGSVILPGLAGGVLTALSIVIITLWIFILMRIIWERFFINNFVSNDTQKIDLIMWCGSAGILYAAIIGLVWGTLSVVRSGLYRDYAQRIRLFLPKFVLLLIGGWLIGFALPQVIAEEHFLQWYPDINNSRNISPGYSYIIASYEQHYFVHEYIDFIGGENDSVDYRTEVIRLADNSVVRRITSANHDDAIRAKGWYWITDTIVEGTGIGKYGGKSILYHVNTDTFISYSPGKNGFCGTASPNGRLAVANIFLAEQPGVPHLLFSNLMNGNTVDMVIPRGTHEEIYHVRWESNDIVAYYVSQGRYGDDDFHEEVRRVKVPAGLVAGD